MGPSPTAIEEVARIVIGVADAGPIDWSVQALGGGVTEDIGASGGIRRVAGTAWHLGRAIEWSVIVKILLRQEVVVGDYRPQRNDPRAFDYWRREADAYDSGLLADLGGGLLAPRCFRIDDLGDEVLLWLEDVPDDGPSEWSFDRYRLAAFHLGQFNGHYLDGGSLPSRPWLSRAASARGLQPAAGASSGCARSGGRASCRRGSAMILSRHRAPLLQKDRRWQLWSRRLTLCHHDAHRRNFGTRWRGEDARTMAFDAGRRWGPVIWETSWPPS
jgi:hypothetical protein